LSNFLQRAITGLLFVTALIGGIWYHYYSAVALFAVTVLVGFPEFLRLSKAKHSAGLFINSIASIILWMVVALEEIEYITPLIVGYFIVQIVRTVFDSKSDLKQISKETFGLLYLNIPFLVLLSIGKTEYTYEPWAMLMIFFMVWANDTGAYLVGRSFGKTKLFEKLSPKKTWEGTLGGLVIAMVLGYCLAEFVFDWNGIVYIGAAFLTGIAATVGDLFESKLKRQAGVKDSGSILPGHGGILDRFDALLLAAPVNYVYFSLLA
jgi:phosphatidate cytidylyltransferase